MWTTRAEDFTVLRYGSELHSLQSFSKAVTLITLCEGIVPSSFTIRETEAPKVTFIAQTTQ